MLIGNLTRDPTFDITPSNTAVCSFGLASQPQLDPIRWRRQARECWISQYRCLVQAGRDLWPTLHKGDKAVYVDGRLQTRDWRADDGQDKRTNRNCNWIWFYLDPPLVNQTRVREYDDLRCSGSLHQLRDQPKTSPAKARPQRAKRHLLMMTS